MTISTRHLLVIILAVCVVQDTQAESQNPENTSAYSAAKISALNNAALPREPSNAGNALDGDQKEIVLKIKEELAQHGVTIRMVNGRYIDVSERVAKGYSLNGEDQIHIAVLNYLQEAYCTDLQPDQLVSGEVQASINVIKKKMAEHGITVQLEDGLFVVRSAKIIPGSVPAP